MEIKFLKDRYLEQLELKLNKALENGWELIGNISFIDNRYMVTVSRKRR